MAKPALLAFNRGILSALGLARVDLKRTALSAEIQTNFVPRVLGSMMLRPGLRYIGSTRSDLTAVFIPFVFKIDDTALIELTATTMRVWVNDAVVTRTSVISAVTNGNFDTDVSGWTDADESGATSQWATGGYLSLAGTGINSAIRRQEVVVIGADAGREHALQIVINRGPVTLKVGSTAGAEDYIGETVLLTGYHSLAFTPTGNFHIELSNSRIPASLVDSCNVEAAGAMTVTTPWAETDLGLIRYSQSADVIFVAADGYQQRRIERRSETSWSVVVYEPEDGPFRTENTVEDLTITPSATTGDITLTASKGIFRSGHVGALFSLTSEGQSVTANISAANTFTSSIKITGTNANEAVISPIEFDRTFAVIITGTWVGTVSLQQSFDDGTTWNRVQSYTANTSTYYNDSLNNQIVRYRIGIQTGEYTSGTAVCTLIYAGGTQIGTVRVTAFTSSTVVSARVLSELGNLNSAGTTATDIWAEGEWSTYRGFPSAVGLHEGRLFWAGKDRLWGSITDIYDGFDPDFEGDAGPISRTIGSGPIESINWILSMSHLILGTASSEVAVRSTLFEEPLTPTNCNPKEVTTQGSKQIGAHKIDDKGVFVQRGGTKVMAISFDASSGKYATGDLTQLVPEIGEPSIIRMAVQRQPDTRIHAVRADGAVALCIFEDSENVLCWVKITTDGVIEDVVILRGTTEDSVYYMVRRIINGQVKRYLEKWAPEAQAKGGPITTLLPGITTFQPNNIADSFLAYAGAATTTITGLSHLEGKDVVVWGRNGSAAGSDLGTFTVSGGQITLPSQVTTACAGLTYTAQFKSTKLAYGTENGTGLLERKNVKKLGIILADTDPQGIKFGPDFNNLDPLPKIEDYTTVEAGARSHYDEDMIEFPGTWDTDSRICLQATAPKPCTVLAAVMEVDDA